MKSIDEGPAPLPTGTGPESSAATKRLALADQDSANRGQKSDVHAWAGELIAAAGGPIPEYGGPAWERLPDESRAKVASCVVAAERYRRGVLEANPGRRRARELEEARRPRPGDHPGGPVPWERPTPVGAA